MTKTEQAVLDALRILRRMFKRVYAWQVAMEIQMSERTARYRLCRLEEAGLVQRPYGIKSGWVLA